MLLAHRGPAARAQPHLVRNVRRQRSAGPLYGYKPLRAARTFTSPTRTRTPAFSFPTASRCPRALRVAGA